MSSPDSARAAANTSNGELPSNGTDRVTGSQRHHACDVVFLNYTSQTRRVPSAHSTEERAEHSAILRIPVTVFWPPGRDAVPLDHWIKRSLFAERPRHSAREADCSRRGRAYRFLHCCEDVLDRKSTRLNSSHL